MSVILELAIGEAPGQTRLADAEPLVAAAQHAGAVGIRLVDQRDGLPTLDPSTVGAYLAGEYHEINYLIDAATTHNAPYNLARRVLSFDRATGGRVGVGLRPGAGDEVSDAATPDAKATDPAARWSEYARILTALWESFPAEALVGDQAAGIVADDSLITPIDHDGAFYRVAGPLDGPSSVQGRPVLYSADVEELGWRRIAAVADAVILDHAIVAGADLALTAALEEIRRPRREIALLARLDVGDADPLRQALTSTTVDGVVIVHHDDPEETVYVIRAVVPRFTHTAPRHLREALGLPVHEESLR